VFAVGLAVAGKTCTAGAVASCDVPMEAPASGLSAAGATLPALADPVLSRRSDHPTAVRRTVF
jgi:hypothetical protein